MTEPARITSSASLNPYTTGPGGFLLDRNGDGHPDDLAIRIVLPPDPSDLSSDTWCALIDLAAHLGLETTGLPERLVLLAGETLPPDCRALAVSSAGEIRALSRAGLADITDNLSDAPPEPPLTDLAALFSPAGLLRDRDGDWLPDGTRLTVVVPEHLPLDIGVAAIEFAARLGLESGGMDLPLAVPAGEPLPSGRITLDLGVDPDADRTTHARLSLDGESLLLIGPDEARAALLRSLATDMGFSDDARQAISAVRELVTAASPLGRAAYLATSLQAYPFDAPVLLHTDDAEEIRLSASLGVAVTPDPQWDEVWTFDWQEPWEVERIRALLEEEVYPALAADDSGEPIEIRLLVSEPREIRLRLQAEIETRLAELIPRETPRRVRVRSAYKAGLSWLREDVLPALIALASIDRIEIAYAPAPDSADGGPARLDLPIRWLQELYPGDELLAAGLNLSLEAIDLIERTPNNGAVYEIRAFTGSEMVWQETFSPRWYELPYIALDPTRGSVLVSTGGIRVTQGTVVVIDRSLATDCDRFWEWYQQVVLNEVGQYVASVTGGRPRLADQPVFAALRVDVWLSEPNETLGIRQELDSAAEALHEDVYFGTLDWLAALGRLLGGDELTGPGSIQPFIHVTPGEAPRARVSLRARRRHLGHVMRPDGLSDPIGPFDLLQHPSVRITAITSDAGGHLGYNMEISCATEASAQFVHGILRAASARMPVPSGTPDRSVSVAVGDRDSIKLTLPLADDALQTVAPASTAPSDRDILFGDDLPPYLARLNQQPGVRAFAAGQSFQGRPLWAIEFVAPPPTLRWSPRKLSLRKPTLLIVGRHHANEVASTTAALQLAERLVSDADMHPLRNAVNVVMLPFANPDGAALHQALAAEHPTWKHHAARYNAVGLEIGLATHDPATPFGEARVRRELWERWLPDVIVDNHGVPSHEWTQHFSGFGSPPRFPVSYWMVQALLYGIMPHAALPAQTAFATELRHRLAHAIAEDPDLGPANATYGHRYQRWGTSHVPARFPAELTDGFLCYQHAHEPDPTSRGFGVRYPATTTLDWITEVPDETAHGDHLALTAHAHLVANLSTLRLLAETAPPVVREVVTGPGDSLHISLRRQRPLVVRDPVNESASEGPLVRGV